MEFSEELQNPLRSYTFKASDFWIYSISCNVLLNSKNHWSCSGPLLTYIWPWYDLGQVPTLFTGALHEAPFF